MRKEEITCRFTVDVGETDLAQEAIGEQAKRIASECNGDFLHVVHRPYLFCEPAKVVSGADADPEAAEAATNEIIKPPFKK